MTDTPPPGAALAAPYAYVTFTPEAARVRTRVRVVVSDDGPMPRVHLVVPTGAGTVNVALSPEEANRLHRGLSAALADVAATFLPYAAEEGAA